MKAIPIQEVRDAQVNYDLDPAGDTILVLQAFKISTPRSTSHEISITESSSLYSLRTQYKSSGSYDSEEDRVADNSAREDEKGSNDIEVSYRVKRCSLAQASEYFENIFMGPWLGNRPSRFEGGIKLYLWEVNCDPEALLVLLLIMHHKYADLPRPLYLDTVAKIVAIAEYLRCIDFLREFLVFWGVYPLAYYPHNLILERDDRTSIRNTIFMVFISWKLRFKSDFRMATRLLVLMAQGPITKLDLPFEDSLIDSLNETRKRMLGSIIEPLRYEALALTRQYDGGQQHNTHAAIGYLVATVEQMRILLGICQSLLLPGAPYVGYNVVSFDDHRHLDFSGLDIDDF